MTANASEGTAKIIPFPKGGRSRSGRGRLDGPTEDLLTSMRVSYADYGSGSYHEAAILEDQRDHKH